MTFKPSDFLFGLIEFLAFIVPGMILFATLPEVFSWNAPKFFRIIDNPDITPFGWVTFVLISYIYGHFIHHISAIILNPIYHRTYYNKKRMKHNTFIDNVEKSIKSKMPSHLDLIRVTEAYIRCNQAALMPELEKHEANSKLFRALSLLCLFLCFYPNISWIGILILVILSYMSFLKFASQRWTHRLLAYEYFSVLVDKGGS